MINFASTILNRKEELINEKETLLKLHHTVNHSADMTFQQCSQMYAIIREFSPDLIIELGRAYGNSTCIFTEAVNKNEKGRIVSIGNDAGKVWEKVTVPKLKKIVSTEWFENLKVIHEDIMNVDFSKIIDKEKRIVLFWDAHGPELSQYILAKILPLLKDKEHLIIIDDIGDISCWGKESKPFSYTVYPNYLQLNDLVCGFSEFVPIIDFISRNEIQYDSPCKSFTKLSEESSELKSEFEKIYEQLTNNSEKNMESTFIFFNLPKSNELIFPDYNRDTVELEAQDNFHDFRMMREKSLEKSKECKTDQRSFDVVLYNKKIPELGNSIVASSSGHIIGEDMVIQTNGSLLFIPSNTRDHVFSEQIKIKQNNSEDKKWIRITIEINPDKNPDPSCVIYLQNEKYENIWTLPFFDKNLKNQKLIEEYAYIDNSPSVRFIMQTISGKASYLPISIKVEQSSR